MKMISNYRSCWIIWKFKNSAMKINDAFQGDDGFNIKEHWNSKVYFLEDKNKYKK